MSGEKKKGEKNIYLRYISIFLLFLFRFLCFASFCCYFFIFSHYENHCPFHTIFNCSLVKFHLLLNKKPPFYPHIFRFLPPSGFSFISFFSEISLFKRSSSILFCFSLKFNIGFYEKKRKMREKSRAKIESVHGSFEQISMDALDASFLRKMEGGGGGVGEKCL